MRCGSSDKPFDAACRKIEPALQGRTRRAIRVVDWLDHSASYALHQSPSGLTPPCSMAKSAVVDHAG